MLIMTNVDFDHPDYFKDIDDVFSAFQEMADNVKKRLLRGAETTISVSYLLMSLFITMV